MRHATIAFVYVSMHLVPPVPGELAFEHELGLLTWFM